MMMLIVKAALTTKNKHDIQKKHLQAQSNISAVDTHTKNLHVQNLTSNTN